MLINPVDTLLQHLSQLEAAIDASSVVISRLLAQLLESSRARVQCAEQMDGLREERQRVVRDQMIAQQKSRQLLDQAKQEMVLQEAWANEMRELYRRAGEDGIDLAEPDAGLSDCESRPKSGGVEPENGGEESGAERKETEERDMIYSRQLLYLTHVIHRSEIRLQSLLSTLQSSPTSLISQAALSSLHFHTRRLASRLSELAVGRERLAAELAQREKLRTREEEKRDEVVLDLVLEWDSLRSDRTADFQAVGPTTRMSARHTGA